LEHSPCSLEEFLIAPIHPLWPPYPVLHFETHIDLHNKGGHNMSSSSANAANRGGRGCEGIGCGTYNNVPRQGGHNNNSSFDRPTCQICFKIGNTPEKCLHRYDENYVPDARHVGAATSNSYTVDTNWYTNTGATDHIMDELEKISFREKYHGGDQIHTANGAGMNIKHTSKLLFIPQVEILFLATFFMFPKLQKVLFLFITLLPTIMSYLNFTHISF
jgi:hypothetical protein